MPIKPSTSPPHGPWRVLAILLILLVTLARLLYLARYCSFDLAPDEAHYWDWSRHLDWSYYSKGPLIAWLIRASCELFGPLSQSLIGSEMLAVRLPAVLCGGLLLASLYVLTVQVFHSEKLGLAVLVLSLTLPVLSAGALLMTIDAPYTCCWGWALVFGYRAAFQGSRWAWPLTGLTIGLGMLAKYTMVLWLPSFGLFLLFTSGQRGFLVRPGFWIMGIISAACCVPILLWNANHGWVTFQHMRGHAGLTGAANIRWMGPLVFAGGQFVLLLGYWFLAWLGAMLRYRPGTGPSPEAAYLWWMSAPMFFFFLLFSFKNGGGEVNWPIAAYLSGIILIVAWIAERLSTAAGVNRVLTMGGVFFFGIFGLALTLLVHRSEWARPVLAKLAGRPTNEQPTPLRRLDPTCRLRGWRTLALEVDRLRRSHARGGAEPVIVTTHWNLAGELGFYCRHHPTVYSIGPAFGDRHSQYDLWRPNPLVDGDLFYGRPLIVIGYDVPALSGVFEWVEPARYVTHTEGGIPIARWTILIGHGYRGMPQVRPGGW